MYEPTRTHEQEKWRTKESERQSERESEAYTSFLIKPIDQLTRPFISSVHLYLYMYEYIRQT